MIRIGVEQSIDPSHLVPFGNEMQIVRVPDEPATPLEIDFYVAPLDPAVTHRHWPQLRGVKVVQSIFAGVDALLEIIPPDVTLCDARGVHDVPISEWVVGAALAMSKFFPFYLGLQREGSFSRKQSAEEIYLLQEGTLADSHSPVLVDELAGKTVLILGYGSIGQAIEERLKPFGVNINRVARSARPGVAAVAELDSLLPSADILICVLPGTSETIGLLDRRRLALLKRGALVINAGRGTAIDNVALADALIQHHLRAALDVTDPEPLPADHPLWKAPNVMMTPHVAGDSPKFIRRAFQLAAEQAHRFAVGEPLINIVTGEY